MPERINISYTLAKVIDRLAGASSKLDRAMAPGAGGASWHQMDLARLDVRISLADLRQLALALRGPGESDAP